MLNTVRILSKLSLNKDCCVKIYENKNFVKNIVGFYKIYKTNIFIIIRISFILANITSFIEDIRRMIYINLNAFKDIYLCFDYYVQRELDPQKTNAIEQMNVTQTGWDFKAMQKE